MKTKSIALVSAVAISTLGVALNAGPVETASEKASALAQQNAEKASSQFTQTLDFEKFKSTVYREPFEGGGYVVNGDVAIPNDTYLLEFYVKGLVAKRPKNSALTQPKFTISTTNGYQDIWSESQKQNLTYCVSREFGNKYNQVVLALASATSAWQSAANVRFAHLSDFDSSCTASTTGVVFDVRPVSVNGEYYARAFFPNYARQYRNVLIDVSAFQFSNDGPGLTLTGIMRHELGHTIGARHEHTRPESGTCFEDSNWIPVTNYDVFSVMHYPHCNGVSDWTLKLTEMDKNGSACVYGAASGFTINPTFCAPKQLNTFQIHRSL
jgi:serine protease